MKLMIDDRAERGEISNLENRLAVMEDAASDTMTPWFPPEVKPVHEGLYLVQTMGSLGWAYWNGKAWAAQSTRREWAMRRQNTAAGGQDKSWRGLRRTLDDGWGEVRCSPEDAKVLLDTFFGPNMKPGEQRPKSAIPWIPDATQQYADTQRRALQQMVPPLQQVHVEPRCLDYGLCDRGLR